MQIANPIRPASSRARIVRHIKQNQARHIKLQIKKAFAVKFAHTGPRRPSFPRCCCVYYRALEVTFCSFPLSAAESRERASSGVRARRESFRAAGAGAARVAWIRVRLFNLSCDLRGRLLEREGKSCCSSAKIKRARAHPCLVELADDVIGFFEERDMPPRFSR